MTDEDARAVLDAAWESGIRYFDTAPHYGLGLSERRLGAFLATKPPRRVRRLDEGRPAAATQPRDGAPARRREPVRGARVAAARVGLQRRRHPGEPRGVAGAPRPARRRRPLPPRPGRARPRPRTWRPACPRWPRCATRGSSRPSGSAPSRPRRCSPRCARGRSTSSWSPGRYTLLEQARRGRHGVPRDRGRDRRGGDLQLRTAGEAAPRRAVRVRRGAARAARAGGAHRGGLRAARGHAAGGGAAVPAPRAGGARASWWAPRPRSRSARTRGGWRPRSRRRCGTSCGRRAGADVTSTRTCTCGTSSAASTRGSRRTSARSTRPSRPSRRTPSSRRPGSRRRCSSRPRTPSATPSSCSRRRTGIRGSPASSAGCGSTTPPWPSASSTAGSSEPAVPRRAAPRARRSARRLPASPVRPPLPPAARRARRPLRRAGRLAAAPRRDGGPGGGASPTCGSSWTTSASRPTAARDWEQLAEDAG